MLNLHASIESISCYHAPPEVEMPITMVTSSGHIHIPPAIRKHLDIKPGDKVQLRVMRDGRVLIETDLSEHARLEPVRDPAKQISTLVTGVNWSGD